MKTIVIASQKGGSGKTMLAAHLAVEAERAGDTAWLIDTDRHKPGQDIRYLSAEITGSYPAA